MNRIAFLACVAVASACHAQTLRPNLEVKAIINAHIQVDPTTVIENGTILIRNGIITEVHSGSLPIPKGAEVLDAKGLTVYAGFIEGFTTKGIKAPADPPRQDVPFQAAQDVRTQMRSGTQTIHAERTGADVYNPDDDVWGTYRSNGFTSALVAPASGVVTGQASVIDLDGRPRSLATIASSVALFLQLTGQGNAYPATALGAFATARQAFLDAQQLKQAKDGFNEGSAFRPQDNPGLAALWLDRPYIVQASTYAQIENALDLMKEVKRHSIVLGGAEAFRTLDRLKGEGVGAILSLSFGNEPNPEKKKEEPKEQKKPNTENPTNITDDEEPVEKKQFRQTKWIEKVGNATALSKAGVPFALTTQGTKDMAEFFTNLRRAIKLGLPKPAAVAALTINPAKMYGLERVLGTVQAGHIANLTIFDKDFAADDAKVKYVYIDGVKIDPAKKPFKYSPPQNFFKE